MVPAAEVVALSRCRPEQPAVPVHVHFQGLGTLPSPEPAWHQVLPAVDLRSLVRAAQQHLLAPRNGEQSACPEVIRAARATALKGRACVRPPGMMARMDAEQNGHPTDTNSVFVWRSQAADGTQGVMVAPLESGVLFSMVFADELAARKLTEFVRGVAEDRHTPAELVRFDFGEVLAEVAPGM